MSPPDAVEAGARHHSDNRSSTNEVSSHATARLTTAKATSGNRKPARTELVWLPCTWNHPQDIASQSRRRGDAAARSVPLDCGCRDPLLCRCTHPPISENALDAWRDAALQLLFARQMPLLPLEVRRALWRRGGPDRVLAERLHAACGGEVA